MHYQTAPFQESKIVSCVRGAIYDVIIDLRSDSSSLHQWMGIKLTAENNEMFKKDGVPSKCGKHIIRTFPRSGL